MLTSLSTEKITPLMLACQDGFFEIVIYLIEHGARVEARDRFKRTPLIHACMYGQAHLVSYLLRRGANPNVVDSSMNTALHYATAYGWYFCVKLLIEAGANPNCTNSCQMTCLGVAFSKGHYGICDYLLAECHADINTRTRDGLTLVMMIVNLKISPTVVEQLERIAMKYKADCTSTDINGRNALHYLALNDSEQSTMKDSYLTMAQILLDQNCNPIQMDNKAQTPLINALQTKNYILVDFFINHVQMEFNADVCHDGKTLLHYFAIDCDNDQLTQMLIRVPVTDQLKIMAEVRDGQGRTPFHYSIEHFDNFCKANPYSTSGSIQHKQYQSIVKMIRYFLQTIECHSDLFALEQPNIFYLLRTIPSIHQIDEHPLTIFLKKTESINILHPQTRRTALLEAIYLKENSIIDLLLHQSSCDINLPTLDGQQTPLIYACKLQFLPLIRLLLANPNCDPLIYDEQHNQALHYYLATSQRSEEYLQIFHLFIQKFKSLDRNLLNSQGQGNRTPLHIAIRHNLGTFAITNDVEQTLIDNQCDLFSQDDLGNLPLHELFLTRKVGDDPVTLCSLIIQGMNYQCLDTKNHQGNTPLYLAVTKSSTVCIMFLLKHRVDLSNSVLSACITSNNLNLLLMFLQQPMNIDLSESNPKCSSVIEMKDFWLWNYARKSTEKSSEGFSLIDLILQKNWERILPFILDELERFHLKYIHLITAAMLTNRSNLVLHLLSTMKTQTVLNETNSDGQNLFHILAKCEQQNQQFLETVFASLHAQQIEWNIPDKHGSYPLHYACVRLNLPLIEFLQKKYSNQLDFNQIDSLNNSAYGLLFCALAMKKTFERGFLQTLITSGQSLDCLCHWDCEIAMNPLSFGCGNSLSKDPSERIRTDVPISPLINAIVHDNFELVKFLMQLGADRNFSDGEQRTPLMHAVRQVKSIDFFSMTIPYVFLEQYRYG